MCYPLCPEHVLPAHPTPTHPCLTPPSPGSQFYVPGPFFLPLYMYFLLHSIYSTGLSSSVCLSVSSTVLFLHLDYSPTHLQGCPLYFLQPLLECHLSSAYHGHFPPAHHFISPSLPYCTPPPRSLPDRMFTDYLFDYLGHGSYKQTTQMQILIPPLTSYLILGKLFKL